MRFLGEASNSPNYHITSLFTDPDLSALKAVSASQRLTTRVMSFIYNVGFLAHHL